MTKFQIDAAGNLQSITDANNHAVVTNTYDARNRLTSSCDALNHCTSYSAYDPDDNLTQVSSATGITTQYQYDHLNRRTLIQYGVVNGNPTSTVTLTYDLGDRLCQAVDSKSGTISRQFGQTCAATGQNHAGQRPGLPDPGGDAAGDRELHPRCGRAAHCHVGHRGRQRAAGRQLHL